MGKILIFSAPSGSGKSTLINHLMQLGLPLGFSISATSRAPRGTEQHGVEYYFLSEADFRAKIANDEFVEYEEVYGGSLYGTLRSEIDRIWSEGKTIVFDIDVAGALNIKKIFGQQALSIFIQPPSIEALRSRLLGRGTDSLERIEQRLAKAEKELSFSPQFDKIVINDDLATAKAEVEKVVREFIF
ncbi:MAG: guanylate kinase [Bacteroidales bacterium]|nr:guanylate kinase [Bacteroidales bacterium]